MGVKIQADEIISTIKERIDDFEINVDVSIPTQMISEQLVFYNALTNPQQEIRELIKALNFKYHILKEEKSKDWFRKFDNKKRWQKWGQMNDKRPNNRNIYV